VRTLQRELATEGKRVSIVKLCTWFGIPRRSVYYRRRQRRYALDPARVARVKALIERFPSYGYRRLAALLGENRKPIQRILQVKGWQVRKRPQGHRPRAHGLPSVTSHPNVRWATDLAMIWCGRDRWCHLALVIDCGSRELLGWRLSRRGHAATAEAALEEALITRFGYLGRIAGPLTLRSDNSLIFTSRRYTATVKAYGLTQEFITPYTPEQNGVIERFIRSLKEECVWQHVFESLSHAHHVIALWVRHYNTERPHQALGYRVPAEAHALVV
jgi:putative transposase